MISYDYIIVGAGSAGCALAARLTESGRQRVLLVEAGEDDSWVWLRIPTGVAKIMVGARALWRFNTEADPGLNGRTLFCPRGKVLGGTSTVNGMFWVLGDPQEYDHWRDGLGLSGWGYADVLPYFKRMESYAAGDPAMRGHDGPLTISDYAPRDPLTKAFLRACAEAGYPETHDYNNGGYRGGGTIQFSTRRGLRWSVREGYLRPALKRANLTLLTAAQVTRLRFDGRRAIGIEYRRDGALATADATQGVVLAAGAIQSPQLLELSGIGDGARLQQLGIATRHHLPGVGENLRDHLQARIQFHARGVATLNDILMSPWAKTKMALRWALRRDGMMSVPGVTAHAYVATGRAGDRVDVKLQLHHLSSPDERNPNKLVLDDHPGFAIGAVKQQPDSRGSVHIASNDPFAAPIIRANYLSHPNDVATFVHALRLIRGVATQPALARHIVAEIRPGAAVDADDALIDYIRGSAFSSYHPIGTCRMGTGALAVVDHRLRVHGLDSLYVADASVFPTIPASNTNAAAIMTGERAADLLRQRS